LGGARGQEIFAVFGGEVVLGSGRLQWGGVPFREYQLPEAAIKLKQGFGRLIRTSNDTGQVVILDPRVRTKAYGKLLLESLPECRVVVERLEGVR
jgi:ATP-dependent DNA helicase DinG